MENKKQQMKTKKFMKIVCVSDTHGTNSKVKIPETGDIFIHAGDFTTYSNQKQFDQFCRILDKMKYKHKIVICGNHEVNLDPNMDPKGRQYFNNQYGKSNKTHKQLKEELKKHCTYLQHEYIQLDGIKIFGSPYTVHYHDTGFHYEPEQQAAIWDNIPDVDILITHGPPYGILDKNTKNMNSGSKRLLQRVKKMKPKLHVFGHIHEAGGSLKKQDTLFLNVAMVNRNYQLTRQPYIIRFECPE